MLLITCTDIKVFLCICFYSFGCGRGRSITVSVCVCVSLSLSPFSMYLGTPVQDHRYVCNHMIYRSYLIQFDSAMISIFLCWIMFVGLSVHPSVPFSWTWYLRNASREFLQICHKFEPILSVRGQILSVKFTVTSHNITKKKINTLIMIKHVSIKWWSEFISKRSNVTFTVTP